jgi:hypothetical protein
MDDNKIRFFREKLAIKYNNAAVNDPCYICGGRSDPQVPLAIFDNDSYRVVCDSCAEKHAPELAKLIKDFYQNLNEFHTQPDSFTCDRDKLEKLLHYATRDLKSFVQMDGFINAIEDSCIHPDEDGDALFTLKTQELMTGAVNIRTLIIPGTNPQDVKRVLNKFADWYGENHFENIGIGGNTWF